MKGKGWLAIVLLGAVGVVGYRSLPSHYNPFVPLQLSDPPGWLTKFKLQHLTPQQCQGLLEQANRQGMISSQPVADSAGECPLSDVVRVRHFGSVSLSSSFLASCPLALSSALFVARQAKPLTQSFMGSQLTRIEHLGSYACRNIYHRADARRSEHASAQAWDISGFQLADGRKVTVLRGWKDEKTAPWLRAMLNGSCTYYGNGLGPEYNAAHANHFHLGMRGYGLCR
ncbi:MULTISPECIES: extensin family protein [Citrobacter]|uniref:extensin-like domain-containing protein n=1 Tax=Citrobacter TaxID=544 RepID=UPI000CE66D00|nr:MULTISPECIES: extensin family protein [Citrobacter]AVE60827.1 extensin [Citrobacter koseri]ELO4689666.1 extensin family protein [Citrobacter koseri]EMD6812020.1 extensin family protein [Citrobacter koseri]MBJ8864545.1 extensin family protein [Citrobacter koseri]MBJ9140005.1 extensin family protein [Citrobacter koseri]